MNDTVQNSQTVSDPATEVERISPKSISVRRPVTISVGEVQLRGGASRCVTVEPEGLGGQIGFDTNVCCSITVSGLMFSYQCDGGCGCAGCSAGAWYEYEGYRLCFAAGTCGCLPDGGVTPDPPMPASVSVAFSEDALFYEEAYTNAPGDVVRRRNSTNATLTCTVRGGPYGGTLSLARTGFDRLEFAGGGALPDGAVEVAAGETLTWSASYAPLTHSAAEGDVSAVATFAEYVSGESLAATAQTTVVEVKILADATFPTNHSRHVFGPQETAKFMSTPSFDGIRWNVCGTNAVCGIYDYIAADEPTNIVAALEVSSARFVFDLSVIAPIELEALTYSSASTNEWLQSAQHVPMAGEVAVGLSVELRLLPDYVSFRHLYVKEGCCPATNAFGFFAPYAASLLPHDIYAGADREVGIGDFNNYAGTDLATALFSVSGVEWSQGGFQYDIPNYWYVKDAVGTACSMHQFKVESQAYLFYPNGDLSVTKYRCTATRGTNDITVVTRSP